MEEQLIQMLVNIHPAILYIVMGLGSLVVIGQAIVAITPTENDNIWFDKYILGLPVVGSFIKALKLFAPIQKKEKKD